MRTLVLLTAALLGGQAAAALGASLDDIKSIAVYSTTGRDSTSLVDVSAFLAGYLSNIKNYTAHNLDLYFVESHEEARRKAAELGADGLLAVHTESFKEYENTAVAQLRLFDTQSGEAIREWSARLVAPYFDPPQYRRVQPYGNLDQVFSELPLRSYEAPVKIRLLVVTDQRLQGSDPTTREYLLSQVETASRVLEREFGIALTVIRLKRWSPPDVDIFGIARSAAGISGREGVDLTLVCLGPPAQVTYWDSARDRTRPGGHPHCWGGRSNHGADDETLRHQRAFSSPPAHAVLRRQQTDHGDHQDHSSGHQLRTARR